MRRYSEAVNSDVGRRLSPPHRQSVAQISAELGIHILMLYNWREAWRLQGEVVPASEKEPEGWAFGLLTPSPMPSLYRLTTACKERSEGIIACEEST
jgi:transposase